MNTIALFSDRSILPGLHVTLASLLAHATASPPLRIVVFGDRLSARDKALLHATASATLNGHQLEVRDFVAPVARQLRSLRGNYTTYGRLFLPDLLPDVETCLYLDCDLVVACPVDGIFHLSRSGKPIYADGTGIRGNSIDGPVFRHLGMALDAPYFNGGVLVLNLERWRNERLTSRCLEFAEAHPSLLLSADQTVLNVICGDSFEGFGEFFNTALWPSTAALDPAECRNRIFHFVGAPKPWDYLGRYANRNYALWHRWVADTAWFGDMPSRLQGSLGIGPRMRIVPATLRELRKRYWA